jgi:epoxyqueuosine reductase
MKDSIRQTVSDSAKLCGFHLAGITSILNEKEIPELGHLEQWFADGRAGEMEYLKRRDSEGRLLRSSIQVPFPWVESVIVCAVNYNCDQPYSIDSPGEVEKGWIARYAWSGERPALEKGAFLDPTDYHAVIRERLEKLCTDLQAQIGDFQARCFVDTGPLIERIYAKYAGLGWQGKNTCLINESIGSWFFLGVILTSIELPREQQPQALPDRCGSCTRCIDACPTDALEPYRMDASRCIAYLTIEKRGEIPEELASKIGRNVFGCDICQEVCPWNNRAGHPVPVTDWPELQVRAELVNPALDWLAELDAEDYRRMFRRSPVERAKFAGFERNVSNARNNARAWSDPSFVY